MFRASDIPFGPREPIGAAGRVDYGTNGGPTTTASQLWHRDLSGIKGSAGTGDKFGQSLY
jgi:hypothetical protein